MTETEARALLAFSRILNARGVLQRHLASTDLDLAPLLDWLQERGFADVHMSAVWFRSRITGNLPVYYPSASGLKWFQAMGGREAAIETLQALSGIDIRFNGVRINTFGFETIDYDPDPPDPKIK